MDRRRLRLSAHQGQRPRLHVARRRSRLLGDVAARLRTRSQAEGSDALAWPGPRRQPAVGGEHIGQDVQRFALRRVDPRPRPSWRRSGGTADRGRRDAFRPAQRRHPRSLPLRTLPLSLPEDFTVAIVGRPNVGKSTLFNRLVGKRLALVDDLPGVTRDRREGQARIGDLLFRAIDTAGFDDSPGDRLEARMRAQTEIALAEADAALMLIDARTGVTPLDAAFADVLRRCPIPVILVANKCEGRSGEAGLLEAYALGLGDPFPISAEHGEGLGHLFEALAPLMPIPAEGQPRRARRRGAEDGRDGKDRADAAEGPADAADDRDRPAMRLAVVGRPNVGKSTLINRLLGAERLLTGPEAGITRDAIAVAWSHAGRTIELVDTAGLRRKANVTGRLEALAGADARRAVRFAHVVVVTLDACAGLEKQDLTIARMVVEEGRALIIAANKWDLITDPGAALRAIEERLEASLPQVRGVPVVRLSALTGRGAERLMPAALSAYDGWNRRVATPQLNRWLDEVQQHHQPPLVDGRRIRLRYLTQVKARPPTFVLFASRIRSLPEAYQRYLINGLRDAFGFAGLPIRLHLRTGKNPYVASDRRRSGR
ncbi:MAG: ribosome biogenesis GTPase Der [Rhodospirillales bacterium]|nr:ribosome biogenesis GTPase Der [Rhodospirillales bacterium]